MKFRSKFNQGFNNHGCLHCAILKVLYGFKKRRAHKTDFSLKIFKIRFLRFWKCLKRTSNSPELPVEWTQNINNRDSNTTIMIFICRYYCCSLLLGRSLMLWNSTFWSHLKLTVQIRIALDPCDPFLINNHNMTE